MVPDWTCCICGAVPALRDFNQPVPFLGIYHFGEYTARPCKKVNESAPWHCAGGCLLYTSLNPKRVFTYEMLIDLVWHEDYTYYTRKAVNNHVSNLRRKLKIAPDLPDYVKSVYGIGYKFEDCLLYTSTVNLSGHLHFHCSRRL